MRIQRLQLENIGPFIEADLNFMNDDDTCSRVTLITGENGTGKSIILDAIRGMFGQHFAKIDRDIRRANYVDEAHLTMDIVADDENLSIYSSEIRDSHILVSGFKFAGLPGEVRRGHEATNWILDYWPSTTPRDSYKVSALTAPNHKDFLFGSLNGVNKRSRITELICHFDYLRDSHDPTEKAVGEKLYTLLEKIIASSLLDGGRLSHIARTTMEPIIIQNEHAIGLNNLSSGNAYLIQNMVSLLGKMYSSHYLRQTPVDEIGQTPGLLLIDEAENQLHPKWQKRFLQSVLDVFPNLQIIATTHSPFIISSMPNARLFVCKSKRDHCVVEDVTSQYSNQPVDQILMSPLFEATQPFNQKITELLEKRKQAIEAGDSEKRNYLENTLLAMNPEYFSYFSIDELIASLQDGNRNE